MIPAQKNIAIQCTNLNIGFVIKKNKLVVLQDINLELLNGELVCLMGENGAGKSTLLKTLSGYLPPLSGTFNIGAVNHKNPKSKTGYGAKEIAVVLTERTAPLGLTVEELVSLGRYPYINNLAVLKQEDHRKIEGAIEVVGLEKFKKRMLGTLSDGQLQKAYIARAFCQDTPIMLLDEPTNHLDLNNRIEIVLLLKKMAQKSGKAILMATHEVDLALQIADKLWLVEREGSIYEGMPEDLILDGLVDKIFPLKGYDLKTGKVQWKVENPIKTIKVDGSDYRALWTKNALERNGFRLSNTGFDGEVLVREGHWEYQYDKDQVKTFNGVNDLVDFLKK